MTNELSETQKTQICSVVGVGATRQVAANYAGCSLDTLIRALQTDKAFATELGEREARCETLHLKTIFDAAGEPKNWRASAWLLERVFADRYAKRKPATMTLTEVGLFTTQLCEALIEEVDDPDCKERMRARMYALRTGDTAPAVLRGLTHES